MGCPAIPGGTQRDQPQKKPSSADDRFEIEEVPVHFTDLPSEDEVEGAKLSHSSPASLHGTDWTTQTIINQMKRGLN